MPHAGDAPLRVAFLGQRTYVESHVLAGPAGGIEPVFVDVRAGLPCDEALDTVRALRPDVVVCFRPQVLPHGALASLGAPVLGVLTEPLPRDPASTLRRATDDDGPILPHPELEWQLDELRRIDPAGVDRILLTDAAGLAAAETVVPVWRTGPLPVADRLYRTPTASHRPPRTIFVGWSTMHREQALINLKHAFDVRHYAHGLLGEELDAVLADADIGIALRSEGAIVGFEPMVLVHLAAGHLVLAEPMAPTWGLEPGLDYLEVRDKADLGLRMHQLHQRPDAYDRLRIRGHHASRAFRASLLWPRLIGDFLADVRAFGRDRPAPAQPVPAPPAPVP